MRILSLPKYNMTLREWQQIFISLFAITIFGIILYDGCTVVKADNAAANKIYEQCTSICYPNPVYDYRLGPNEECRCNTGIEYRK